MTEPSPDQEHSPDPQHSSDPQDDDVDLGFRLDDRVCLVTGGASGIGLAVATVFAERGARVVVADVDGDAARAAAETLSPAGRAVAVDVTDPDAVEGAVGEVLADTGRIDVLVNSAGVVDLAPAESLGRRAWDRTIAVNLSGTFFVSQAVGRHMLERGRGKIVNLASQAGTVALDEHAAYCASKAGVLGLTRVLASEWAGRGVTVNAISPTVVLTPLGRAAWAGEKGEAARAAIPTGRFALPREIAAAALFLACGASDMVNGADLVVDGGYTIR